MASPGLPDFFTYASAHERPWQLRLENREGAESSTLHPSQREPHESSRGLGSGPLKCASLYELWQGLYLSHRAAVVVNGDTVR